MTPTPRESLARWTPAAAAAGAIGAAALVAPFAANAAVDLPDKTPGEVLDLIQSRNVSAFSGTVEQSSNLGLPDLSALDEAGGRNDEAGPASTAVELLTESHTVQVFVNGQDQTRLQVLDRFEERNLIRNGDDVWYYNSEENEAVHGTVGIHRMPNVSTHAPNDIAAQFLDKIGPSTEVAVGSDRMVAGRAVYDLILTPRSTETLVGSVTIAVDGETGLPLGVTVTPAGSTAPAFTTRFNDISYETPSADVFAFTPPDGATVTEAEPGQPQGPGGVHDGDKHGSDKHDSDKHDGDKPTVVGEGWDTVVVSPAGEQAIPELLGQLSTPVEGGRLISTALVNMLVTDDGRILAGSVTVERLQAVAAGQ